MLEALWLTPPIAVARLGSSDVICANFEWAANDAGPGGTGKTTLRAIDSLELDDDGTPREVPASDELVFKDRDADGTWHFRPVCPYFELHGTWTLDGQTTTGPVTTAVLEALGVQPSQVTWNPARQSGSPISRRTNSRSTTAIASSAKRPSPGIRRRRSRCSPRRHAAIGNSSSSPAGNGSPSARYNWRTPTSPNRWLVSLQWSGEPRL